MKHFTLSDFQVENSLGDSMRVILKRKLPYAPIGSYTAAAILQAKRGGLPENEPYTVRWIRELDNETPAKTASEQAKAQLIPLINQIIDIDFLSNRVIACAENRIKERVRDLLGASGVIEDLRALDTIWGLSGDTCISFTADGKQVGKLREIEHYEGRQVRHVLGLGTVAKMRDGNFGIRLRTLCGCRCGRKITLYAKPGVHLGAFAYAYDSSGYYLGDLRNVTVACLKCIKAGKA